MVKNIEHGLNLHKGTMPYIFMVFSSPEKEKEYRLKYYRENKDRINAARRQNPNIKTRNDYYYYYNKDLINEPRKEKFNCACGGKYTKCHQTSHAKSIMHTKWLAEQPE